MRNPSRPPSTTVPFPGNVPGNGTDSCLIGTVKLDGICTQSNGVQHYSRERILRRLVGDVLHKLLLTHKPETDDPLNPWSTTSVRRSPPLIPVLRLTKKDKKRRRSQRSCDIDTVEVEKFLLSPIDGSGSRQFVKTFKSRPSHPLSTRVDPPTLPS